MGNAGRRILRNPDLVVFWDGEGLVARVLESGISVRASPEVISVLDLFGRPCRVEDAVSALREYEPPSLRRTIKTLARLGLLLSEREARTRISRTSSWKSNVASAHYHVASRDGNYLERPQEVRAYFRKVASVPMPPQFKRCESRFRRRLGHPHTMELFRESLGAALTRRRTTRRFSRRPVRFEDFAAVVGGTWARTGWIEDEILGRLAVKTSPSAGALHPIECYVIAWNVRDLAPGLYHYDVIADELRRLRAGDFRAEAVRAASGQRWIRGAAFLCVMTAFFARTLWKYPTEAAYRTLWLDAGHLAQTFSLLATARGLGPFTTAAMQDTFIERLVGLDGVTEFPVYLCGAGVPERSLLRSTPRSRTQEPGGRSVRIT